MSEGFAHLVPFSLPARLTQFVTVDSIASVYLPLIRQNPWLMFYFIPLILVVSISLMNLASWSVHHSSASCFWLCACTFGRRLRPEMPWSSRVSKRTGVKLRITKRTTKPDNNNSDDDNNSNNNNRNRNSNGKSTLDINIAITIIYLLPLSVSILVPVPNSHMNRGPSSLSVAN